MTKQPTRKFRPSLLHLEDRKLMTVRVGPVGADTFGLSLPPVAVAPPATSPFDNDLTVTLTVDHRVSPAVTTIEVDGSDFEDHVQVLDYRPGQSVTVQLEKWSNGVQLSSSTQTLFLAGHTLRPTTPLIILGRGGNDQLRNLTALSSHIEGGTGNDFIAVGLSSSYAEGQDGDDTIIGSNYADTLFGGTNNGYGANSSNDGNDYIRGGDGGDTISAGGGINTVYGEGGDDYINAGYLPSAIGGMLDGGDGNDYINAAGWNVTVYGGNGNDTIYASGALNVLSGGAGNDTIYGGAEADTISGGAGNDTIFGGSGDDVISGGDGDDVIHGDDGIDVIQGNDGNDRLYGDSGADYLYGQNGDDYLDGGYGEYDYLLGGYGADTFVRHKRVFWFDDVDNFADYNSAQGDSTNNVWHW